MTTSIRDFNYLRENTRCQKCGSKKKKYLYPEPTKDPSTIAVFLKCTVCQNKWLDHFTNEYLMRLEKISYNNSSILNPSQRANITEEIIQERLKQGYSV